MMNKYTMRWLSFHAPTPVFRTLMDIKIFIDDVVGGRWIPYTFKTMTQYPKHDEHTVKYEIMEHPELLKAMEG
jgi:hypothetical protein|tara:strand:- start:24 stop:242 length:219 start_codon:yes stop_codon:yes gene_type:complete